MTSERRHFLESFDNDLCVYSPNHIQGMWAHE